MSAHEAYIRIHSSLGHTLFRKHYSLGHGEWVNFPDEELPGNSDIKIRTDSNGFMTGTEAEVTYGAGPNDWVKVYWSVPFGQWGDCTVEGHGGLQAKVKKEIGSSWVVTINLRT